LPAESVALQLTVVEPTANHAPGAGLHVTVSAAPLTASVAVGRAYVICAPCDDVASVHTPAAGTVPLTGSTAGAVVSHTLTAKPCDAELPLESVAVHVT
jgi:hypothetical protein